MNLSDLNEKISNARDLSSRPRKNKFTIFNSVGELLTKRVAQSPERTWLIFYDRDGNRSQMSYKSFADKVLARAQRLLDEGMAPGDRIATFSGNYPETVEVYFACWYLGMTVVPLNINEDHEHTRYILKNSNTKLIATRSVLVDKLKALLSPDESLHKIKIITEAIDNITIDFEPLNGWMSGVAGSTEALIVYTSGTTGHPKGVVLDHYNLLVDALALAQWHNINSESRMMCVLPIHHVNGTIVTLMTPFLANASVVLNERFSVNNFFQRIADEKVEVVSVVPTLLAFLLEAEASIDGLNLKHLRHIICGAGPLTVDLAMRFENKYNIPIAHGYGLSETTCYSCCLPVELKKELRQKWLSDYGYPSIGVAFPVNEMAIHDANGNSLGPDERGEIVIRGHNVMTGYFANQAANESAFTYGWFRSGDEGFWRNGGDGRPYFFITGRIKELIIRGGVNISPFEIDEVLMSIPGVRAGIAVGFEHELYGEEVGAYIQKSEGMQITENEVIDECKEVLPWFKCPKVVLFGDNVPVTSTGKYQRNKLKSLFSKWRTAKFHQNKD